MKTPSVYGYSFNRIPEQMDYLKILKSIISKAFSNPIIFIINFALIHLIVILTTFYFHVDVPAKVMLKLGLGDVAAVDSLMLAMESDVSTFVNAFFLIIILILDFGLLLVIKSEVKSLKLSMTKILLIEIVIFAIGLINPYVRTALFFFSANTLQIAIAYRWFIKKWIVFKWFFIAGSYILLIKLIIFIIMLNWR